MTAVDRLDVSRFADRFAGIADNIERGHGQVECVELTRQYLHLSPLVDVA